MRLYPLIAAAVIGCGKQPNTISQNPVKPISRETCSASDKTYSYKYELISYSDSSAEVFCSVDAVGHELLGHEYYLPNQSTRECIVSDDMSKTRLGNYWNFNNVKVTYNNVSDPTRDSSLSVKCSTDIYSQMTEVN